MGTTLNAIKLVMTSVLSTRPWLRDPGVISIPWNSEMEEATLARAKSDGSVNGNLPLKFGIFWSDGVVTPQPPVARGLRTLFDILKASGHSVSTA